MASPIELFSRNGAGPNGVPRQPRYAQIVGWGMAVPERVLTNHDLAQMVDTSDEWIRTRTGIAERRIASSPKETTSVLAVRAAREALRVADVPASAVDLIICATSTPDYIMPPTACLIQDALGAKEAGAFDLGAACSGFVYGLSMARGAILAGDADYVLVVGAETLSRLINWKDRQTCILFGDGAGAVLLAASPEPGGVLATTLGADGSGGELLMVPAGGSAIPTSHETLANGLHNLRMDGKAVFRFATRVMAEATKEVAAKAGWSLEQIDLVVPHQANQRILQSSVVNQLKIPESKVVSNLERYGNTSAASIPIALCEAIEQGRVRPQQNMVLVGFGGGLTWGAVAVRWCAPITPQPTRWWKSAQRQMSYQAASLRSWWRRSMRRVYTLALGPANEKTPRGRVRMSVDRWREERFGKR